MNNLMEYLEDELKKHTFDFFVLEGFKKNTNLAILCGMVLGYSLGFKKGSEETQNIHENTALV